MCESCYEERITAEFGKVRLAGFDKALPPYQVLRLANDVYFQLGKPGSAFEARRCKACYILCHVVLIKGALTTDAS